MRTNADTMKGLIVATVIVAGIVNSTSTLGQTILNKTVTIKPGCGPYAGPFPVQVEKGDLIRVKTTGDFTVPWPGLPAYDNQPGAWFSHVKVADPLFQATLGKQTTIQVGDYTTKTRAIDLWEFEANRAGTVHVYILDIAQWGGKATVEITLRRILMIEPIPANDTILGRFPAPIPPEMIRFLP